MGERFVVVPMGETGTAPTSEAGRPSSRMIWATNSATEVWKEAIFKMTVAEPAADLEF